MSEQNEIVNIEAFVDDKLNRLFLAENLKTILLNTTSNVFSINAPWGGGKSYFISNLEKLIGNEAICISYNAWESDFYNNPLVPIVVELLLKLEQLMSGNDILSKDFTYVKNIVNTITEKTTFNLGVSCHGVNAGVNIDPNKPTAKSGYNSLKKLKKELQNRLILIQEKLNKNIIIFIDELDRCNPRYAIETLEAIKHFFGIKNIIFVLAVDKIQIENIVKTIYGIGECPDKTFVDGYLRKFIDVEFNLPEASYSDFINFHFLQMKEHLTRFGDLGKYYNYSSKIAQNQLTIKVEQIVKFLKFQLRDIEKLFLRIKLTIESLKDEDILLIEPICILNALYIYNKNDFYDYVKYRRNNAVSDQINSIFPYWESSLLEKTRCESIISKSFSASRIAQGTKESNILELRGTYPNINIPLYLSNYASKIEFIGDFD